MPGRALWGGVDCDLIDAMLLCEQRSVFMLGYLLQLLAPGSLMLPAALIIKPMLEI